MKQLVLLIASSLCLHAAVASHPRVWLDATKLAELKAKALAGDTTWTDMVTAGTGLNARYASCLTTPPTTVPSVDFVASQGIRMALGYAVASTMTAGERTTASATAYASWGACAVRLAEYSLMYYGGLRRKAFTGDGTTTQWALDNAIVYRPYRIRVNGASAGEHNSASTPILDWDGAGAGAAYYWEKGTATIRQGSGLSALTGSDTLEVFYHGDFLDCRSGTYNTPVVNDGTYGYFAGSTWTTTTNISCPYIALPTAIQANGLNDFRNNSNVVGLIFDWCYDLLTSGEKSAISDFLRGAAWQQAALGKGIVNGMGIFYLTAYGYFRE